MFLCMRTMIDCRRHWRSMPFDSANYRPCLYCTPRADHRLL